MLRSLMTAVTGVRAHQTMLDVTGNNIANANTIGFKKDFTIFEDLMYQTTKNATGPGDGLGGIDPAQVGLGVQVAAIETIHTQGASSFTGNPSDMMIQGKGFFVYGDGAGGSLYSRAGAIVKDSENNFVQSGTGYRLQGYAMEEDPLNPSSYVQSTNLTDVNVPIGKKLAPKATSEVKYQCNLDSRSTPYLPYGYPDLPYNADCGWPGNPEGTARITMDGETYDVSFQTNRGSADGEDYLTITLERNGATETINFDMYNTSGGKPFLEVDSERKAAGPAWVLPGTTTEIEPVYDKDTGAIVLKAAGTGETLFQYNIKSAMNYATFSIDVTNQKGDLVSCNFIAEFDESVKTGTPGSELSKTKSTLTIWYRDPDADANKTDSAMKKMTAVVHFNAAGYFESVDDLDGDIPNGFTVDTLRVVEGSGGSALLIQQGSQNAPGDVKWNTVGQINQGGFHQTKQTIYDCNGNTYTLEVNFKKITENRWRWEAFLLDSEGNAVQGNPCEDGTSVNTSSDLIPMPHVGEVAFCGCGPICYTYDSDGNRSADGATVEIPFSLLGMPNQKVLLNFGGDGDAMYGVTQYASDTTTKAVYQDGYPMGVLQDFSIGTDGTITGNYTNGKRLPLYRVALATFSNEQGLEKAGDTMFKETVNSGNANIDAAGVNGKGIIMAQNLEMSNVDLTEEFTHLILAQRGFQANTRVITVSDQILEEVVNLKR